MFLDALPMLAEGVVRSRMILETMSAYVCRSSGAANCPILAASCPMAESKDTATAGSATSPADTRGLSSCADTELPSERASLRSMRAALTSSSVSNCSAEDKMGMSGLTLVA